MDFVATLASSPAVSVSMRVAGAPGGGSSSRDVCCWRSPRHTMHVSAMSWYRLRSLSERMWRVDHVVEVEW